MSRNIAVLYSTIGTEADAAQLANLVLSKKLATCINIIPGGKSIYLWDGEIKQSNECYMLFKTAPELIHELEHFIINHHPYDVPAILKFKPESSEAFASYISNYCVEHSVVQ